MYNLDHKIELLRKNNEERLRLSDFTLDLEIAFNIGPEEVPEND